MKIKLFAALAVVCLLIAAGAAGYVWRYHGLYGFNVLSRNGGNYWIDVKADDKRLSPIIRLAMTPEAAEAVPGAISWREVEPGFEVGELPVMLHSEEVDRLLLSRIDPARFRFVARNDTTGHDIDEWEKALPQAVLIVNGSYYGHKGEADTPFLSEGQALGPKTYDAKAGAFIANANGAGIAELSGQSWQEAFKGADNAMVSYPLLIGADGQSHVTVQSNWLANRTFVAEDHNGRIIIGSTKEGFFSLGRLADFLKAAPLDIKRALNFDGGPIACQSVRLKGFSRKHYAQWELQPAEDHVRLLWWPVRGPHAPMPVVLTVERK